MLRSKVGLLVAALAMTAAMPALPALEVRRRSEDEPLWPMKPDPDNRGRRSEKDAAALAKAEAKRQRKSAKRVGKVGVGETATKSLRDMTEADFDAAHNAGVKAAGEASPLDYRVMPRKTTENERGISHLEQG